MRVIADHALRREGFRRAVLEFLVRQQALSEALRSRMLGWRQEGRQGPLYVRFLVFFYYD